MGHEAWTRKRTIIQNKIVLLHLNPPSCRWQCPRSSRRGPCLRALSVNRLTGTPALCWTSSLSPCPSSLGRCASGSAFYVPWGSRGLRAHWCVLSIADFVSVPNQQSEAYVKHVKRSTACNWPCRTYRQEEPSDAGSRRVRYG